MRLDAGMPSSSVGRFGHKVHLLAHASRRRTLLCRPGPPVAGAGAGYSPKHCLVEPNARVETHNCIGELSSRIVGEKSMNARPDIANVPQVWYSHNCGVEARHPTLFHEEQPRKSLTAHLRGTCDSGAVLFCGMMVMQRRRGRTRSPFIGESGNRASVRATPARHSFTCRDRGQCNRA